MILKTITYFDVQDHAVTLLDIHKYLIEDFETDDLAGSSDVKPKSFGAFSVEQILDCLEQELSDTVGCMHGFYFLNGREDLAYKRLHNNFYAGTRFTRIQKFLPRMRYVPFVSAVALTGSEALNNSKEGSDIDVLVFTEHKRMWLARLCVSAYFQIFGIRRHGVFVKNRFCLNHYIQNIKVLSDDRNIYTAVEYVSLIPYFGADVIHQFQTLNLPWIRNFLSQPVIVPYNTEKPAWIKTAIEKLFSDGFGDWCEAAVGSFQKRRIKIQEYILVERDELSFHPASKGQQVIKKFLDQQGS